MTRNQELAKRFGTPLYVYDLDRVADSYRDLRDSLPAELSIFYSLKANPHPEIARAAREAGGEQCRAEVTSVGELAAALQAGFLGGDCLYTGPGKTEQELAEAMACGVRTFSVESLTDLERTGAVAVQSKISVDCLLRINSASSAAATSYRMTGAASQFGIGSETIVDLLPKLSDVPGTKLVGTHFFPMSNARDEPNLIAEFQQSVSVAAWLHTVLNVPMRLLDIGGGFAAPYAVRGSRPVYGKLRAELEGVLDGKFPDWRAGKPQLACESGRYLVADCGELVTSVSDIKEIRGQRFIVLDAGINVLGGMSGLGRMMPIEADLDNEYGPARPDQASLVGPLCAPGDVLARNAQVPSLKPGDVITVPNVGAYGLTASLLLFLSRPAAVEAVVRGEEIVSVSRIETSRVNVS